jgi:hypothetical protein
MNTYAPSVEAEPVLEDRLDIARALYKSLVAQYPDKMITLCDDRARVLSHSEGDGAPTEVLPSRDNRSR